MMIHMRMHNDLHWFTWFGYVNDFKWHLVCENRLRIEATGAIWKFNNFRIYFILFVVWKSARMTENRPKTISDWFKNHWQLIRLIRESLSDLFENYQESSRITENQFDLFKNHQELISDLFENHRESLRINFKFIWESSRITENQFLIYLRIIKNHWESISDLFKNHQESPRIAENQ